MRMLLAWIDYVDWRQNARDLMTRTLTRMINAKTNHAMALWKSFNTVMKQKQQDHIKLSRFMAKLTHQGALRTFLAWIDYVDWCLFAKDLMTRTMTRMMNAKTNHAMALWKSLSLIHI